MIPLPGPPILWTAPLLDEAECREWIAEIERLGPEVAPITTSRGFEMRPDVRTNTRVIVDDPARAAALYARTRPFLPGRVDDRAVVGLNERFRCYRYEPGQFFAPHSDGAFHRDEHERSLFTMLVYLNEGFEGGETLFHRPRAVVRPRTGLACFFWHPLVHEGAPVLSGAKYVLRTDVMTRA
jgi:prolyl 4-hydroxylase